MIDLLSVLIGAILGASITTTTVVRKVSDYVVASAKRAAVEQPADMSGVEDEETA